MTARLPLELVSKAPRNLLKVTTKTPLARGVWHHVLVTYDGSAQAAGVKIYVDGEQAEVVLEADKLSGPVANSGPLLVGKHGRSLPFAGALDDVRIYDRVLATEEVQALAGAPNLAVVQIPAEKRTPEQQEDLTRYFRANHAGELTEADNALQEGARRRRILKLSCRRSW